MINFKKGNLTIVTVIVVGILVLGALYFAKAPVAPVTPQQGAAAGPEYTERQFMNGGLTYGQGCFSTTTTGTLTQNALKNGCIVIAAAGAGQGTLSITLPASTTMPDLIPKAGNCTDVWVDATAVAAATTTTFVAGTGHNVVGLDATGAGTGADVIDGNEYATLTMCRETDGDVATFVREWIHAD